MQELKFISIILIITLFCFSCNNPKQGILVTREGEMINNDSLNSINTNNSSASGGNINSSIATMNQKNDTSNIKPAIYYATHKPKIGDQKMLMGRIFDYKTGDGYSYWECIVPKGRSTTQYQLREYPEFRLISGKINFNEIAYIDDNDTFHNAYNDRIIYFDSSYNVLKEINLDSLNPYLKNKYNHKVRIHFYHNEEGEKSIIAENPKLDWKKLIDENLINGNTNYLFKYDYYLINFTLTAYNHDLGILHTDNTIFIYNKDGRKIRELNNISGNIKSHFISKDGSILGLVFNDTFGEAGYELYDIDKGGVMLKEIISQDFNPPSIHDYSFNDNLLYIDMEGLTSDKTYKIINVLIKEKKAYQRNFTSSKEYMEYLTELGNHKLDFMNVFSKYQFNLIKLF